MKKILLALFILTSGLLSAQSVKISAMPSASGDISSAKVPIVINGANYAATVSQLRGSKNVDSVYLENDSLKYRLLSGTIFNLGVISGGGAGWSLTGNSSTIPATNFIGTIDAVDLVQKTHNIERLRVLSTGNVGIGLSSPVFKLDVGGTSAASDRKIGINGVQFGYIPNETDFLGSLAIGTGLQQLIPGAGYSSRYNTTTGIGAGDSLTLGFFNTFNGSFSSHRGKYISETVSSGFNANRNNKGSFNVVVGASAFLNCDTCETSNVVGNLAGFRLITANQVNLIGYRVAQFALDAHFTDIVGYRGAQNATSLIGVAGFGQNVFGSLGTGFGHSAFGAFTGGGTTGGRYTSFFGYYSGNTVRQKADAVNSTSIGAFSYGTRDYETVIGSKDSSKHLWLYATDSLQANLVRTTSYGWVWAFDSATRNSRYMPIGSIGGGGGTIGGSIASTQIPVGSGTNTVSGSSALTFSGGELTVVGSIASDGLIKLSSSNPANHKMISTTGLAQLTLSENFGKASLTYNYGTELSVANGSVTATATYATIFTAQPTGLMVGSSGTATAALDVNSDKVRIRTAKTPSSSTATGNTGDIAWDSNYVYVCIATDTWKRSPLTTW